MTAALFFGNARLYPVPMSPAQLVPPTPVRLGVIPGGLERSPSDIRLAAAIAAEARQYSCNPFHPPVDPAIAEAVKVAGHIGKVAQALYDMYKACSTDTMSDSAKYQPHCEPLVSTMAGLGWALAGSGFFSLVFTKNDLAIKLGLKAEDSGAAYAAWARDNAGMAGVPTIHDIQRHGKQSYTVVMPKYVPVNEGGYYIDAAQTIRDEGLSDTMDAIETFFRGVAQIDIHEENVMRDLGGRLIITDPVSYKKGPF
jgi:hypothetical protein